MVVSATVASGFLIVGVVAPAGATEPVTPLPVPPLLGSWTFGGPADQTDPHLSGDHVAYTDERNGGAQIVVGNLADGSTTAIGTQGAEDFLPDIDGSTLTYTHLTDVAEVKQYDLATGTGSVLAPGSNDNRRLSRIGDAAIVWQDFTFNVSSNTYADAEIVGYDRATGVATRLTNDTLYDQLPAISPAGDVVVWMKCQVDDTGCHIWQATHSASGWSPATQLTSAAEQSLPHTDGHVVTYVTTPAGTSWSTGGHIAWQPVGGGPEHVLDLPGIQTNPNVSNGVITFEQLDTTTVVPNYDVYMYDIATGDLFRLTDTPQDETLNDVEVSPGRQATVAWMETAADDEIQVERFDLPPVAASLTLSPLDGTGALGTTHTVTASVRDEQGQPLGGATVQFAVSGSVTTAGSCTTDGTGSCGFTYTGPSSAGADEIDAYVDTNATGAADPGEPHASATWSWQDVGSTFGAASGGGQLGSRVTFSFAASSSADGLRGGCTLIDHTTKSQLHCGDVTRYVQTGSSARIEGHATVDGAPTTYVIAVTDNGEPGAGADTFAINTASGYAVSGTLAHGNVDVG
jgi:Tol biopolymer transport system component